MNTRYDQRRIRIIRIGVIITILLALIFVVGKKDFPEEKERCYKSGRNQAVIIILDGADWKAINHLLKEERLPTFKYLIENGASGNLYSVDDYSTPNEASIFTGVYPSKHGITTHFYLDNDSRTLKQSLLSRMKVDPVWKSQEDNYCYSVISFISTPEAMATNNIMVGSLFNIENAVLSNSIPIENKYGISYMPLLLTKRLAYPKSVLNNLNLSFLEKTGGEMKEKGLSLKFDSSIAAEKIESTIFELDRRAKLENYSSDFLVDGIRDILNSNISAKFVYDFDAISKNSAVYLLSRNKSNVYFIYFMGTDTYGHFYDMEGWHINQINMDAEKINSSQEQFYRYYEVIDKYLSEIINAAGRNTTFLILSDHGKQDVLFDDYLSSQYGYDNKSSPFFMKDIQLHTPKGIFIAYGPNIAKNKSINVVGDMTYIAPTLYCILNTGFNASEYDGRVIKDIFKDGYLNKSDCYPGSYQDYDPFEYYSWNKNDPSQLSSLNDSDRKLIAKVIKGAIEDYSNGSEKNYIWQSDSFTQDKIVVVELKNKVHGRMYSWWVFPENNNILNGIYNSAYNLFNGFNLTTFNGDLFNVYVLYNRTQMGSDYNPKKHSIGVYSLNSTANSFFIYKDYFQIKDNMSSNEHEALKRKIFSYTCARIELNQNCFYGDSAAFFYFDTIKIENISLYK